MSSETIVLIIGTVAIALVAAVSIEPFVRESFWDWHIIHGTKNHTIVYTMRDCDGTPVRVLRSGGALQSATYLDENRMKPPFKYFRVFGDVLALLPWMKRLLVLGGGGCTLPKLVADRWPSTRQVVVEVDPAIAQAASTWFFLDEAQEKAKAAGGSIEVICEDGRSVLDQATAASESFDAIVLDAFSGSEPVLSLATLEAVREAHELLGHSGVLLANIVDQEGMTELLRALTSAMVDTFTGVWLLPCEDENFEGAHNVIAVASDTFLDLPEAVPFGPELLGAVLLDESLADDKAA